jgi:hypothetical protein
MLRRAMTNAPMCHDFAPGGIGAKVAPGRGNAMKDMLLHWSPRSPYVRKVLITAHETGIADRKIRRAGCRPCGWPTAP